MGLRNKRKTPNPVQPPVGSRKASIAQIGSSWSVLVHEVHVRDGRRWNMLVDCLDGLTEAQAVWIRNNIR